MTNRRVAIYDGLTDTFVEREATEAEQAEIDAREKAAADAKAEKVTKEAELKSAKAAILSKLGLTEAEAITLLTPEAPKPITKE
jgi:hypothetical protein